MATENNLTPHYFTSNESLFKCDICVLTFRTSSERNVHILDHFRRKTCSICHQTLVQLGNIWYGEHEHSNHDDIKTEFESEEIGECVTEPLVFSKSDGDDFGSHNTKMEVDPIGNWMSEFNCEEGVFGLSSGELVSSENVAISELMSQSDDNPELQNNTRSVRTSTKRKRAVISTQQSWQCEICKLKFSFEANLIEHKNVYHREEAGITSNELQNEEVGINDKQPNGTTDEQQSNVTENLSVEEKGYVGICGVCDKKFACRSSLKYHMNLHRNIKPYVCDLCEKTFSDKRNLGKHRKICQHVPGETTKNSTVSSQEKIADQDNTEKRDGKKFSQTCDICNKNFKCRSGFKYHQNRHRGIKPFACDICDKAFYDKRNMTEHRKTHEREKQRADLLSSGVLNVRNYEDSQATREISPIYWLCEYCNTHFEFDFNLTKHISKEHSDDNQEHQCNICAGKFNQLDDLLVHMRAHPESSQYKCTFDGCGQGFAYKADFATHLSKHNRVNGPITRKTQDDLIEISVTSNADGLSGRSSLDKNDFVCHICSKQLANKISLQLHIERTHTKVNDRIKCTVAGCDKIFKSVPGLTNHIKLHHPKAVNKCDVCQRNFYSETLLAEHKLKHIGSFHCSFCSKIFKTKHSLRAHIAQHEKDAICNICNEKFASVKSMMEHRERHGKKQMLTCRFKDCNQVFEDRREFMAHASQHPESGKKKVICSHCGKAIGKGHLRDHINSHTGERPHECVHCKKTFARNASLRRHLLIHSGKKPYACDIEGCDRTYRDSIDLKRHKFSVHKIYTKKHICSICSKVFPERKLLTKHTTSVHNKVDLMESVTS